MEHFRESPFCRIPPSTPVECGETLLFGHCGDFRRFSDDSTLGYGEVFQLRPPAIKGGAWTEYVLYSFKGFLQDGGYPRGNLVWDSSGNLYGATEFSVYELSPPGSNSDHWTFTQLHQFPCCTSDGFSVEAGVILDQQGNVYGTTEFGGYYGAGDCESFGCGTVFEISPPAIQGGAWTEQVLYGFKGNLGNTDGELPLAGLVHDAAGNLYGDTAYGGTLGTGTVFELSPPTISGGAWTESILYNLGYPDGWYAMGTLIFDTAGNLYGTTKFGGNPCIVDFSYYGCGTIFKVSRGPGGSWTGSVVYHFGKGPNIPRQSQAGLYLDRTGAFYGTTSYGGDVQCVPEGGGYSGCGTVFQLKF